MDYGADFYAAQTWSDIPREDGRRIMLAWMNNWDYADKIPTHPWRGQMTFPRKLALAETEDGLRLKQSPVREIESLRQDHVALRNARWSDLQALLARRKWPNTFELVAELQLQGTRDVAFELRKGSTPKPVLATMRNAIPTTLIGHDQAIRSPDRNSPAGMKPLPFLSGVMV